MTTEKTEVTVAEIPSLIFNFTGIDITTGKAPEEKMGLLNEKLTIGTKSRMQKIVSLLEAEYKEYQKLFIELLKKYGATEETEGALSLAPEKRTPEFNEEFQELLTQKITLGNFDRVDFKQIEKIETENNYNIGLLSPRFIEGYNGD